jgi:hypothetical protein
MKAWAGDLGRRAARPGAARRLGSPAAGDPRGAALCPRRTSQPALLPPARGGPQHPDRRGTRAGERPGGPRARLRRPHRDPHRGRDHHAVVRAASGDPDRRHAGHGRGVRQRRGDDAGRDLPPRLRLGAGGPARRRHSPDGRGGRLLRPAAGTTPAACGGRSRGGVRAQRCADGAARHACEHRRAERARRRRRTGRPGGPGARRRRAHRDRHRPCRRVGDPLGGAPVVGAPGPGRARALLRGVRRGGRCSHLRLRGGVRRRPRRRQRRAPAPRGDAVVHRGRRVAGADRHLRHARAPAPDPAAVVEQRGPRPRGRRGPDRARPSALGCRDRTVRPAARPEARVPGRRT